MTPRIARTFVGLLLVIAAAFFWKQGNESSSQVASSRVVGKNRVNADIPHVAATSTNATIARAVDGDTLIVRIDGEDAEKKVRLLGVNTPESVDPRRPVECFGKEASRFTASLADGKRARLEEDPQADDLDKYGRLLRNVILEDGTDLNLALVREGYAHAYVSYPQNKKRKTEIKRLQREAQANQRGLWNPKTCEGRK